ncbi:Methyl-accepting chemotaxis protein 2 [Aquimixticola soesokkakensis]|uniref:Methyl-accepting chemotaxis protein 2 n=1 Tax=Aquimixticola soesokkakensis TaxID=1519096 RepID=A0A1Y5SKP1_9RHOB|nr:methyl-accepting chemotaxis protein [Aquimixticola soesokkakensis]SLN40069.1 Methyl-accepting chemotaxis protein 2 [Aquimixticola soesokkakensis]
MIPNPNFTTDGSDAQPPDARLTLLAKIAAQLGFEVVDIAGFLDQVDGQSRAQVDALRTVHSSASEVISANAHVREAVGQVTRHTEETRDIVATSVTFVRASSEVSHGVARWVTDLAISMDSIANALKAVQSDNAEISAIAKQVNILAINAKIEAARAGSSGRGFGVVAEAINELSRKTAKAAEGIQTNTQTLGTWIEQMRDESGDVSKHAHQVISDSDKTDAALTSISQAIGATHEAAQNIAHQAEAVQTATNRFAPILSEIDHSAKDVAQEIHAARERVNGLIDRSESIVQTTVALGAASDDEKFIARVQADAARISGLFERALESGQITREALFDQRYREISGTNPPQVETGFTKFTDAILPEILEAALTLDPRVAFCAAVDHNGYLPTHNRKFSQPQGQDAAWNAANCRNRRIFNDRVGLKAGRNTDPFLLQVYRRDMGGGSFAMMKDLSAPIVVQGRHWGGLRLAYTI